jgi:hypothetical protein
MSDERRHHERYNNEQLILNVARPGIKGFLKVNPCAECMDFSLTGLQFSCEQPMVTGEALVLDLCVSDIELNEIYGEVVSCKQENDGSWCCGVSFSFADKRMQKPEIKHSLLMIEDKLRSINEFPETTV